MNPSGGAERDREHGDTGLGGDVGTGRGRTPDRRLAVGEQHDCARREVLVPTVLLGFLVGRVGEQIGRHGDRVADRGRLVEVQAVDAPVHTVAIERRLHLDADDPGERHEADLDVVVDLVDEVACGILGRLEAVRCDVGRLHRQRHVEQHEDPTLAPGAFGGPLDRSCDGDDGHRQSEQLESGDDVAPPARSFRRHPVEQVDLGEADLGGLAPRERGDVARSEQRRRRGAATVVPVRGSRGSPRHHRAVDCLRRVCAGRA